VTERGSLPLVAVYADESCLGNGREGENPGGAAGLIELRGRRGNVIRRDYWVSEPATTNNHMALRSAIEAFRILSVKQRRCAVVFTSDSRYLVDGITSWVHDWARRGWRRKTGPIENSELWLELMDVARPHLLEFRWVRGHAGHPQNEWANLLAIRAAREQTSSGGAVESGFEAWFAAADGPGDATPPDPSPDPANFKPMPALPVVSKGSLLL
jgi:ribonuclease HI